MTGATTDGSQFGPVPPLRPGTALVTGAARRVGAAIAEDLAARGWRIAAHFRGDGDAAMALVDRIRGTGAAAVALRADLADEVQVRGLLPAAASALGPVTLLVNNASTFQPDDIATVDRASWDAHLEPNLRAPVVLIQALAANRPADRPALVVNMLDQRVLLPDTSFLSYTLSKIALWSVTKTLAVALAPWIRVTAIGPGPTLPSIHQTPADFAAECDSTPLRRGTSPTEICATLRWLIASPAVTGQMIALDGGQHLTWPPPGSPKASAEERDVPGRIDREGNGSDRSQ